MPRAVRGFAEPLRADGTVNDKHSARSRERQRLGKAQMSDYPLYGVRRARAAVSEDSVQGDCQRKGGRTARAHCSRLSSRKYSE